MRLRRWLYGMRRAASAWEAHFAERLCEDGLERSRAAPATFVNPASGARLAVWGDDFTFLARAAVLDDIVVKMSGWYDIKVRGRLGPGPRDLKSGRILNRLPCWGEDGLTYEGDDKHARTVIAAMGLDKDSKGSDSPLPVAYEEQPEDELLPPDEAR